MVVKYLDTPPTGKAGGGITKRKFILPAPTGPQWRGELVQT